MALANVGAYIIKNRALGILQLYYSCTSHRVKLSGITPATTANDDPSHTPEKSLHHALESFEERSVSCSLGALGGTLNGDSCSLLGVIWVLPGYIGGIQGLHKGYIR